YNVQLGLKSTTEIADVFAVYTHNPQDHSFHEMGLSEIEVNGGSDFVTDFQYLYKFYKETIFVKFMVIGPHLYMGFRIGKGVDDLKAFKFRIEGDGTLTYIGNRYDHEYVFPPQQEFEWIRAHRDMHRDGIHPHISIEDRLFVETTGGDLTVKIEDNTSTGQGIYDEPVDNADQTLDDAEVFYATIGSLIVLKIKPYQEKDFRILVFNEKTSRVQRIDSIDHSCVLLPDDHGIIFSNGYHLQTGETKIFESDLTNMFFDRRIASSNGEDFLFIFYNRLSGDYILMPYNLIEQKVDTPIICSGYSLFENGELIYFRSDTQAQKHHTLQIWRTPYTGENYIADAETDSFLYKLGNADVVRCMAECYEVLGLLAKDDSYADLYIDLTKKTGDIGDSYFWVGREEAYDLKESLVAINGAAQSAIAEFDKVQRLRRSTGEATSLARDKARKLISAVQHTRPDDIMGFVHHLAELRAVRGEVISLRDLRYIDSALVDDLEEEIEEATRTVSGHCVEFLLLPEALDPYREQVDTQRVRIPDLAKVSDADQVAEALGKAGEELEMLIDIVGNLKIDDSTKTTQIIDDVSTIYSILNQVRVELKNRRKELARGEGVAQFGAQIKLLNQAVINYLDLCHTPGKTEEYLTKVMVQIEELEGKFSEFDEYIEQLSEKREEIYDAFEARKQSLVEERNRRAGTLVRSGERILGGIRNRVAGFETINEINGYLASDLMIDKVREVIAQLTELGDPVKADDIQTQLKTLREEAVRQLKDRSELFVDGKNIIQLGNHKFSVNTQALDLSVLPRDGEMFFHLGGTDFFEQVDDGEFLATREVWDQQLVSENREIYRAEFLAWKFLPQAGESPTIEEIQQFMGPRYAEGYTKGVHDEDALKILAPLASIHQSIGLLRFSPAARALAILFLEAKRDSISTLEKKIRSYGLMGQAFENQQAQRTYIGELQERIGVFADGLPFDADPAAGEYLFWELQGGGGMTVSPEAAAIVTHFNQALAG
ncbi:MAG: DNA repair ATPase, partial [Verrucomicrobiales bacterium]